MSSSLTAAQILNREFLEIRAKLLELAAAFDRLDRAEGLLDGDPRLTRIHQALDLLASDRADRAEQVQLIFSRTYDHDWRRQFGLPLAD